MNDCQMAGAGVLASQILLDQETRLMLPSLDLREAVALGQTLLASALERGIGLAIEVHLGSRLAFRAALPGTTDRSDLFVAAKRRVVERFGHSSLYERTRHQEDGTTFEDATGLSFPDYAAVGGGFPLVTKDDGRVGVVCVSGLAAEEDHAFIVEGLERHIARGK